MQRFAPSLLLTEGIPTNIRCHSPTPCPSQHFLNLQTPRLFHQTPPTLLHSDLHLLTTTSPHTTHPQSCLPSLCKHPPIHPLTTISRKNTPPPAPPSSCHRSAATISTKLSIHHMASAIQEKAIWDTGHERERLTVTSSLSTRGQLRAMG